MLVLQGEAGSGKSALLEHVATDAKDFRILRCTGVESEAELPFAALHLLLLDCLDRLDSLPAPQARRCAQRSGSPKPLAWTGS